ncbi:MAG: hypothetical protein Q7S96_05065 [bacterium]|nr:hypothetical protein [bacterium]
MTLTLIHLLYLFYGFLVLFGVLALAAIWHMVKFGTYGTRNYVALFLFLAGVSVVMWGTFTLLRDVDWSRPLLQGLTLRAPSRISL